MDFEPLPGLVLYDVDDGWVYRPGRPEDCIAIFQELLDWGIGGGEACKGTLVISPELEDPDVCWYLLLVEGHRHSRHQTGLVVGHHRRAVSNKDESSLVDADLPVLYRFRDVLFRSLGVLGPSSPALPSSGDGFPVVGSGSRGCLSSRGI